MKKSDFLSHSGITTGLLILSVVINILLAYNLRESRNAFSDLEKNIEYDKGVLPGEKVPPLVVLDTKTNETTEISYKVKPTVLYVFTPDCVWCVKNLDSLKRLASQIGDEYNFYGISLKNENLSQYIEDNEIGFPVYHSPPKDIYLGYKMGRTPQTFVISSDGHLIATWAGAFEGEIKKQIEQFFDVALADLKIE